MALRTLRLLGFPRSLRGIRYLHLLNLVPSPRFLTLDFLEYPLDLPEPLLIPNEPKSTISERFALEELSSLLSFDPRSPNVPVVSAKPVEKPTKPSVVGGLLSSEEKLRGVFFQKLKGKSSVESALSSTGVDLTDEVFANVLNRGNLGGAEMVFFFDWATKQPRLSRCLETYHVVLKALGRRKFFGFMEEILLRMKKEGLNPTLQTATILMDSYVRARRVYRAVELFKKSEEFGCECASMFFNVLMHCLCRRSHVRLANALFTNLKGKVPHDIITYNEIIGGWARLGRISKVETIWLEMIADGLTPDCNTYSYYIEGLGRTGRVDDAVDVFDKMKTQGCIPDTCTYNVLISNFISVGHLDKCMEYYSKMIQNNCLPDINTYTKLIGALLKVRRVADALELFDKMLSTGFCPTTGMVTSFLEVLCSYGPPVAAMMVYKKSKKAGCTMSLKAYKLLLMRLSRFGKCGMVLKVWEEMQDSGYSSDVEVYEYIVNGLCNIGNLDNAVVVVEESLRKGFCIGKLVYSKLNNKLLERGKMDTAYKLFLKVKEARSCDNGQRFWRSKGWHF